MDLALGFFKVFIDLRFVVQVKGDCTIDPGHLTKEGKILQNTLRGIATIERINHQVEGNSYSGCVITAIALFDLFGVPVVVLTEL